jgi:hypothetical protein
MPPSTYRFRARTIVILVLLLLLALGAAGYFFYQNHLLTKNTSAANQAEADKIIAAVGKLIYLPQDEKPTVATVADPQALKSQPFFAQAEVGDKVLIYTTSKEAILYRPSVNKIIAVSPITFENQQQTVSTNSTATPVATTSTTSPFSKKK